MSHVITQTLPAAHSGSPRIGELLLERELITDADLAQALSVQQRIGGRLGAILVRIGAISEDQLLPVLADQLGFPLLTIDQLPTDLAEFKEWLDGLPILPQWWFEQRTVCWAEGDVIHGIAQDPLDPFVNETLEGVFESAPVWHLMRAHDLDRYLERLEFSETRATTTEGQLRELAEEAPVVEFVNNMIAQATEQGASDVHLTIVEAEVKVRFRIDGVLYEKLSLPRARMDAITSRIKLISGMDIAERRLPQDGRIRTRVIGQELDIRVSVLPGVDGESIVMRLLPTERSDITLSSLGLAPDHEGQFRELATSPNGIILVTGPTGSGKSTTLYAMLNHVNDASVKIITVEDPVEYEIDGITQVQTMDEIGLDFARVLRSTLRQDPDVLMVGEIRDLETAQIAIQASLTGHLVLSTLHTNDAAGAFVRLTDIGVDEFLVATPLRAVIAQRLVRRLCDKCKVPTTVPTAVVESMDRMTVPFEGEPAWSAPRGCSKCGNTGYRGRLGIFELLPVNAALRDAIVSRQNAEEIAAIARAEGFRSMREDGLLKATQGLTSIDEVLRVTSTDA
ncbi:MAG: GspE/PulE family protein [Pseudomonadota bacterium]